MKLKNKGKPTYSPSFRCRSTIQPTCRNASARLLYRRSIRSPVSRIIKHAPGCSCGPLRTSSDKCAILYGVTVKQQIKTHDFFQDQIAAYLIQGMLESLQCSL